MKPASKTPAVLVCDAGSIVRAKLKLASKTPATFSPGSLSSNQCQIDVDNLVLPFISLLLLK